MHPPAPSSRTLTGNERRIADICGENTMPRHEAGNMSAPDLRGRFPCGLGSAARNLCASLRRRADAARRERSVSPRHLPSPWRKISWQTSPRGRRSWPSRRRQSWACCAACRCLPELPWHWTVDLVERFDACPSRACRSRRSRFRPIYARLLRRSFGWVWAYAVAARIFLSPKLPNVTHLIRFIG